MRVKIDWRSASKEEYAKFRRKYPEIKLSWDEWRNIIYSFNEDFKTYVLSTGEKAKLPGGFGDFAISKKKRKRIKTNPEGREFINMAIDWKKTKEKGKRIYNFNYHTEGYSFWWMWFRKSVRFQNSSLWYFKPTRVTSRLLTHYLKIDNKYQHLYQQWKLV